MTKALKSLVLAASVLAASSAMAQTTVEATPTSKCGVEEKCVTLPEFNTTATGGSASANASANANQTSTGGMSQYGAVTGGNSSNVSVTVFQPGVVNLSACLAKGHFNRVCVIKKLQEVEASLKPFSKCDPLAVVGDKATKLKCGFTLKQ